MGAVKEMVHSYRSAGDLSGAQFYPVKLSAVNTVALCGAVTDRALGILQNKPRLGEAAAVLQSGRSYARADGGSVAIAAGDHVGPAANGRLIKKATADNSAVGIAMTPCTADNMVIEVLLGTPDRAYTVLT